MALIGNETLSYALRILTIIELHQNAGHYAKHPYFKEVFEKYRLGKGSELTPLCTAVSRSAARVCDPKSKVDPVQYVVREAFLNCRIGHWTSFISMMAVCEVLGVSIQSYYPEVGNGYIEKMLNTVLYPRTGQKNEPVIHILWSCCETFDTRSGAVYEPNHFAPLFKIRELKNQNSCSLQTPLSGKRKAKQ